MLLAAEAVSRSIIMLMTLLESMVASTPVDTMTGRKKMARAKVRPWNSLLRISAEKKLNGTTTMVSRRVMMKELTIRCRKSVSMVRMYW